MHVTAAEGHPADELSRIERELLEAVKRDHPIRTTAAAVCLYEKSDGIGSLRERVAFGASRTGSS